MKRISFLLLGIAVSLSALCQNERHLTGTVKNAKGQNIEYVTVEVKKSRYKNNIRCTW